MKTPFLFSIKKPVLSKIFAFAIIVSVITPNTFFIPIYKASAEEVSTPPASASEASDSVSTGPSFNDSVGSDETSPSGAAESNQGEESAGGDVSESVESSTPSETPDPVSTATTPADTTPVSEEQAPAPVDVTPTDVAPTDTVESTETPANIDQSITPSTSTETISLDTETLENTREATTPNPSGSSDEPRAASSEAASTAVLAPATGSISICKVIRDQNNRFVARASDQTPPAEFKVQLSSRPNPERIVGTATFNTATYQAIWTPLSTLDAECVTYNNLPLGGYVYGQETITGEGATYWNVPRYNDQVNIDADTISDFWAYSNELFDNDTTNDASRNENSDGIVTISRERPNRTVVVLNKHSAYGARNTGSITICKVIQDANGNIIGSSGTNLPPAEFKVQLFSRVSPPAVVRDATFNTATFASTSPALAPLDSQCITYDNLALGGYIYQEERISGTGASYWATPKYNDQVHTPANSTANFWSYSPELFDTDSSNDSRRNEDADGIVTITETRPNRVVVVLNTFSGYVVPPPACANGTELTPQEFLRAKENGLISFNLQTLSPSDTTATFTLTNNTGCTAPISLSSYRVFDPSEQGTTTSYFLSRQVLFDNTDLIQATSSVSLTVNLPTCMAQVDAWYGRSPGRLLDSNPYAYPNVPHVIAYEFYFPTAGKWNDLPASYCVNPPVNTAPTITLVGENPFSVTVGNAFTDQGATALDLEDGDLTSAIVATGTVDTNTVGTYTLTYTVTDSGGLKATTTRTINVGIVSGTPPDIDDGDDNNNGGGGGGRSGGRRSTNRGEVLGATTAPGECEYLRDYLKQGWTNDTTEVLKLQYFLKNIEGYSDLETNGVFDNATFAAVSGFQTKYFDDVLKPWGHNAPTGFVYILSKKKVNEIFCNTAFPLTMPEEQEIADFKNLIGDLNAANIDVMIGTDEKMNGDASDMVGVISPSSTSTVALYGDPENTTEEINPKDIRAVAAAIFSIPDNREEVLQSLYFFLIAIIAIYLLTEIAVGSRDTTNLSKYQVWSRKAIGYIIGLIAAVIISIWYQIFSIVVPFLVLAVASGVFLVWTLSKKKGDSVIQLPPSTN